MYKLVPDSLDRSIHYGEIIFHIELYLYGIVCLIT